MNDAPSATDRSAARSGAKRFLRRHLMAYAGVNGVLFLINLLTAGPWWFFWPVFGWGIAVTAHWLYVKSVDIDDQWVDQRTEEVRQSAYDLGHIEDIEKRYGKTRPRGQPPAGPRGQTGGGE